MKKLYILLIALFAINAINATIIYVDIVPDTIISTVGGYYDSDLNGDGIVDFKIKIIGDSSCCCKSVYINCLHDSCFVSFYWVETCAFVKAYNINDSIGYNTSWLSGNACLADYFNSCFSSCSNSGSFLGQTDKCLGLKLIANGIVYFGWVRIDVAIDATWFKIKDYAYDINPIIAGSIINNMDYYKINKSFSIFPNPANTTITIELPQTTTKSTLSVFNITGEEVIKQQIIQTKIELDVSRLPSGMYFVRIISNKAVYIEKIFKE
ncbi:MAG: T9SS type A sorting domain-containing protein [Bacteroidales bacterium]|nr:T9SS type A sorting domain-containing protein [Bacteroidales bacterium]